MVLCSFSSPEPKVPQVSDPGPLGPLVVYYLCTALHVNEILNLHIKFQVDISGSVRVVLPTKKCDADTVDMKNIRQCGLTILPTPKAIVIY